MSFFHICFHLSCPLAHICLCFIFHTCIFLSFVSCCSVKFILSFPTCLVSVFHILLVICVYSFFFHGCSMSCLYSRYFIFFLHTCIFFCLSCLLVPFFFFSSYFVLFPSFISSCSYKFILCFSLLYVSIFHILLLS